MAGHGEKLTRKMVEAIAALLTAPTVKKAAAKAGVAYRTLRGWLNSPEFQQAYRDARRQAVEGAIGRLQRRTGQAVRTLQKNLKAEKGSDQNRAAVAVLDYALRGVEMGDLAQQVEQLKAELEGLKRAGDTQAAGGETADRGCEAGGGDPSRAGSQTGSGPQGAAGLP